MIKSSSTMLLRLIVLMHRDTVLFSGQVRPTPIPKHPLVQVNIQILNPKHPLVQVNIQIFLLAYLIENSPSEVFTRMGDLERNVVNATEPLLECYDQVVTALSNGLPWHQAKIGVAKQLQPLLRTYLFAFKAWKLADDDKTMSELRTSLATLGGSLRAMQGERDTDDRGAPLRLQIVKDMECMRKKLAYLEGQASASRSVLGKRVAVVTTPHAPEKIPRTGPGMSNEEIAHEMILDENFNLTPTSGASDDKLVRIQIRKLFEEDYFKCLAQGLTAVPMEYSRIIEVLKAIKTGIQDIAKGHPEAEKIGGLIDMELITQNLAMHPFDYDACTKLLDDIVAVLLSMHSRMKTNELQKDTLTLWGLAHDELLGVNADTCGRAVSRALELILDRMYAVRVHNANAKLKGISHFVRGRGVEFEQKQFDTKITDGTLNLGNTIRWIENAVVIATSPDNTSLGVQVKLVDLVNGNPRAYEQVVYAAMMDLVINHHHCGAHQGGAADMPATILLDLVRVKVLHSQFHATVIAAILLATLEQQSSDILRSNISWNHVLEGVRYIVLRTPPNPSAPQRTIELVMRFLTKFIVADKIAGVQSVLEKNVVKTSTVYLPMTRVITRIWFSAIKHEGNSLLEPQFVAPCARFLLPVVEMHSAALTAMAQLNRKVHVMRYNDMILRAANTILRQRQDAQLKK
jgi:hypothetical protein